MIFKLPVNYTTLVFRDKHHCNYLGTTYLGTTTLPPPIAIDYSQ